MEYVANFENRPWRAVRLTTLALSNAEWRTRYDLVQRRAGFEGGGSVRSILRCWLHRLLPRSLKRLRPSVDVTLNGWVAEHSPLIADNARRQKVWTDRSGRMDKA
jgi:hypothetical protein